MNSKHHKKARYIYNPQLKDPRLDFYPDSAFDFDQEPWVAPMCLLARETDRWEERTLGMYTFY